MIALSEGRRFRFGMIFPFSSPACSVLSLISLSLNVKSGSKKRSFCRTLKRYHFPVGNSRFSVQNTGSTTQFRASGEIEIPTFSLCGELFLRISAIKDEAD
jgi:hypothetical protein